MVRRRRQSSIVYTSTYDLSDLLEAMCTEIASAPGTTSLPFQAHFARVPSSRSAISNFILLSTRERKKPPFVTHHILIYSEALL
jgi:hypothetical protein